MITPEERYRYINGLTDWLRAVDLQEARATVKKLNDGLTDWLRAVDLQEARATVDTLVSALEYLGESYPSWSAAMAQGNSPDSQKGTHRPLENN